MRIGSAPRPARAARRLSEATGADAMTIHRLLEWRPGSSRPTSSANAPPVGMLIDEASMINLHMADVLLNELRPHLTSSSPVTPTSCLRRGQRPSADLSNRASSRSPA